MRDLTNKAKAIHNVTDTHIYGFFDTYRYLSNFHLHSIEYEGILYPANENAYQASKTLDREKRLELASCTPSMSKSRGRGLSLRADWHSELPEKDPTGLIVQVRDKIMYDINVIKFSNTTLRDMLLATGDKYLEETNWWRDDYWGVMCGKEGLNKLGLILMKIRHEAKLKQSS